MLSKFRPAYERHTIPIGMISVKLGLSPDFWTYFSVLTAAIAGGLIALGHFWWGLAFTIVMNLADMLDGATARAGNTSSRYGTVLDHVCDRYAEFFLIAGFAIGNWISPGVAVFTASGIVMASYVRAKAESAGGITSCVVGFAGRQEKLFLIWISLILLALNLSNYANILIILVGVISHVTAVQRLAYTKQQLNKGSL